VIKETGITGKQEGERGEGSWREEEEEERK
jgi:hypothetical protein